MHVLSSLVSLCFTINFRWGGQSCQKSTDSSRYSTKLGTTTLYEKINTVIVSFYTLKSTVVHVHGLSNNTPAFPLLVYAAFILINVPSQINVYSHTLRG